MLLVIKRFLIYQLFTVTVPNRKIIFILTDGKPDCYEAARDVLAKAETLGFEVYGIGIKDRSIEEILPKASAVIMNLAAKGSVKIIGGTYADTS